jgi:hypothetical protein
MEHSCKLYRPFNVEPVCKLLEFPSTVTVPDHQKPTEAASFRENDFMSSEKKQSGILFDRQTRHECDYHHSSIYGCAVPKTFCRRKTIQIYRWRYNGNAWTSSFIVAEILYSIEVVK